MQTNDFLKQRLISLDVFRGATIAAMILVNNPGSWSTVYPPLLHAEWHGWTFTDLIFPFFLFIVGVAIVYALGRQMEKGVSLAVIYKKIVRRTLILFLLGLFLNGFPYYDLSTLRIPGVLQRIAVCYFFSSVIFLHFKKKGQIGWVFVLLLGYWALMEWIPVPGVGAGSYARGANLSNYIDSILLGSHVWKSSAPWDPEGILSTLPAIATTLIGVLTGSFLKSKRDAKDKSIYMLISGNALFLLGSIWHYWMPVNKQIWTSSYVVLMSGLALIVLGTFYYLIDVRKIQWFTKPFVVYGANAITVFVLSGIVGRLLYIIKFTDQSGKAVTLKTIIYKNLFTSWLSPYNASLAYALCFIALTYLAMWLLYKKKIFIKI
ncbi:MAG TPA: DUF5009 domain-containing protein [Caldithrix abyssi]|uniref:DUF5009 domain-containing protein n=1 Tax=Caldithrix abyssi TaxID=187145 RepID=A0A7V4U331_CALAY|nr:DUF5009 domain-containing protein [Caldithrix abyssi]